jgi:hypothetical protein
MATATRSVYVLVIREWRCAIPQDWKLEIKPGSGPWQAAQGTIALRRGDRLRGQGGGEESYLAAMQEHGYVKREALKE